MSIWMTMAFQAGMLNVGGFLACHRFVSHVTGFATFFGVELAQKNFFAALSMLTAPLFFIAGAMVSSFVVDRRILKKQSPLYPISFALISLFMGIVVLSGTSGLLGTFSGPLDLSKDYVLLALLCLSTGLQNATVTSASGAIVRTTHLTGISTDLGIGLVRMLTSGLPIEMRNREARTNSVRMGLISFFILGSTLGAFLFLQFEYLGFLGPMLISAVLTVYALKKGNFLRVKND